MSPWYDRTYSVGRPHHPLGAADDHPLHHRRLRAEREPECEAAGGVLPPLRHHPDPGGHAGADRWWEVFCLDATSSGMA